MDNRYSDMGRVALFGGSFDPPHRAHLAIAQAAADAFSLDRVWFAPTGLQPLKPRGASAPFVDRLAMVSLACEMDERFAVSDLDAPRSDGQPNYTVDTLERLKALWPSLRIFAIAGADSFLELPRWRESPRLLELAEWIVVSRPGFSLSNLSAMGLPPEAMLRVHLLTTIDERVSATELRARLARGENCSDAVPSSVLRYLRDHNLYG